MKQLDKGYVFTDIGTLEVVGSEQGIISVSFVSTVDAGAQCRTAIVQQCIAELSQYFGGGRRAFTVPLDFQGTPFRRAVWTALLARKPFFALTGNGVNHPNDFGHRIQAQAILALLHADGE